MARKASTASPDPTPTARCESPQRVVSEVSAAAIAALSVRFAIYGWYANANSSTAGAIATMAARSRALVIVDIGYPPLGSAFGIRVLLAMSSSRVSLGFDMETPAGN